MIGAILKEIAEKVEADIGTRRPEFLTDGNGIALGNISQLDGQNNVDGKIIMSLVNIEQDTPLRNNPYYTNISETQIKRHNPQVVLNLYVLFACIPTGESNTTIPALEYIFQVIAAFQKQNVFTVSELNFSTQPNSILQPKKIIFDQYSMTFEQLNHLWGVLGGKYLPSVLYKVRLICVFVNEDKEPEEVIRAIEPRENVIN